MLAYLKEGPGGLKAACISAGTNARTFLRWVDQDHDGLLEKYIRAERFRSYRWEADLDEMIDIGRNLARFQAELDRFVAHMRIFRPLRLQ